MSTPQLERFLKDLREAAVVAESEWQPILERNPELEPRGLALALVQAGLLTDWQAKFILSGRNRLRVGNYLLQERLRRDEMGDGFLAWHEPLHRQVRLQILPESVTRQSPVFQAVTNLVGQLTALDHPRLEHVYDLGEEGGRLYVVYEVVPGEHLEARRLATLTQGEAAGLLQGVSAALATLQGRCLAHGEIAHSGLLLEPTGEGKLVGMCEANLRRTLGAMEAQTEEDWLRLDRREWKELAERLFARQFRTPEFDSWRKLMSRAVEEPNALGDLAQQIDQWRRELQAGAAASDVGLVPQPPAEETSTSATARPSPATPGPAAKGNRPEAAKVRSTRESHSAAKKRAGTSSPWRRLYSLVVAALATVGLLSYLLWRFVPGEASNQTTATALKELDHDRTVQSPVPNTPQPAVRQGRNAAPAAVEVERDPLDRSRQSSEAELPKPAQAGKGMLEPGAELGTTPPEVSGQQLTGRAPGAGLGSEVELVGAAQAVPSPAGKQEKDPFQIPAKAAEKDAPGVAEQPNAAAPLMGEQSVAGTALPGQPAANGLPTAPPAAALPGFPAMVNLGRPGEPACSLGAVPNLTAEQLTLHLLYDPETVGKSRIVFELQPQVEQSGWSVVSRKRAGDPESLAVGEFLLADGQLQFRWAEGLDLKSNSLSLCNCLLKIEPVGGAAFELALREPLLIEDLLLDEKTLKAEAKFDLPAAPNMDSIAVVVGPFPRQGAWAEALVLNEDFEDRQPAVVVFRPVPNEQLFGLTLERRWRGQAELTAAWALQGPELPNKPGPNWVPTRQSDFQLLVEGTAQAYTQSVGVSEAATRASEDAPFGSKTKLRNLASEAKNNMLQLKARNELMGVHQEKLAAIRSGGIPLRLVYRVAEREVVLAETAAAREATLAVEAESKQPPAKDKRNNAKGMK